jgi:hypothetical protein
MLTKRSKTAVSCLFYPFFIAPKEQKSLSTAKVLESKGDGKEIGKKRSKKIERPPFSERPY